MTLPLPSIRAPRARAALAALVVAAAAVGAACAPAAAPTVAAQPAAPRLVDPDATPETRALFANLRALQGTRILFGHQDDLAYGYEWTAQPGRSDVKEAAGAYPAVYGWELGNLELGMPADLDGVRFDRMREWIVEGYRRGAVIAVSWHMANPVSGRNAWDTTRAVAAILPGGARHAQYVQWLDRFADFAGSLRAPNRAGGGTHLVPIVFRPTVSYRVMVELFAAGVQP